MIYIPELAYQPSRLEQIFTFTCAHQTPNLKHLKNHDKNSQASYMSYETPVAHPNSLPLYKYPLQNCFPKVFQNQLKLEHLKSITLITPFKLKNMAS